MQDKPHTPLSNTKIAILVIAGLMVWPVWLCILGGLCSLVDNGKRYEGSDLLPMIVVLAWISIGIWLWKWAARLIEIWWEGRDGKTTDTTSKAQSNPSDGEA